MEIDASPALGPAHGGGDPGLHDLWLLGPRAITATEACAKGQLLHPVDI